METDGGLRPWQDVGMTREGMMQSGSLRFWLERWSMVSLTVAGGGEYRKRNKSYIPVEHSDING